MEKLKTHTAIAKIAGVSQSTVSKVFNNYPGVSADTRQAVRAAATKLNYKPDPALSALTKRRWNKGHRAESVVIGLLWTTGAPAKGGNFKELHRGAIARASELGYVIRDFTLGQFKDHASLDHLLERSGISALISLSIQDWQKLELDWSHLYHVFLFGHSDFPHLNQIRYDWFKAVDMAVSQAVQKGHRRIGFASSGIVNTYEGRHLLSAYLINQSELKSRFGSQPEPFVFKFLEEPFANKDFAEFPDYPWAAHPLCEWVRGERIDCVIGSDMMLFHMFKMAGWAMPRDFSYISLRQGDNYLDDFVTAVGHRPYLQGESAVDVVHHLLQTGQKGLLPYPIIRTVEGAFIEGKTLIQKRRA